jgi:N-acylneuraminate cytidylyltransferase
MIIAIIPARGGSVRIPRKNVRDFQGKPIIAYSIETAKASDLFDGGIWVSTEDDEIAKIARQLGAGVIHRPPELAEVDGAPDPGTQEVTRHAITVMQDLGDEVDYACCIYATAPLMRAYYLRLGFQVLARNPKADFAYSVDGETQRDAAQFYWGHAHAFLKRRPFDVKDLTLENVWRIVLPSAEVCDINTIEDFEKAERMYLDLRERING